MSKFRLDKVAAIILKATYLFTLFIALYFNFIIAFLSNNLFYKIFNVTAK